MRKWKYLDNIRRKIFQVESIKIGILIGANCSKTIQSIEIIPSQEGIKEMPQKLHNPEFNEVQPEKKHEMFGELEEL